MTKVWAKMVGIAVVGAALGCIGADDAPDDVISKQGEIRNGTPVALPRSESQVLILTGSLGLGSGTLLSQEWVLTAGHVVDSRRTRTSSISVRLGNQSDPAAQVRTAVAVYHHPSHLVGGFANGPASDVDVALVRVSPPFTGALTRGISTLPTAQLLNTAPICNGYGQTVEGFPATSGTSTIGSMRVTSVSTNFVQVAPGVLLNELIMSGDSGGPCFDILGAVVGVMSSAVGVPATAGFFVPAAAFRTWALGIMANCNARTPGSETFCSAACPCVYGAADCEDGQCSTGNVCDPDEGAAFGYTPTTDVCVSSSCAGNFNGSDTYCSASCPCGHGGGDCDATSNCLDGFVCAVDYGPMFKMSPVTDVCVPAACNGRTIGADTFCSAACPCGHGGGDCDSNSQCMPGLVCATDLGPAFNMKAVTDVCVPAACVGTLYSSTFCSAACPCGHGGGDCDSDAECMPGLKCVQDAGAQFGASASTDICMRP